MFGSLMNCGVIFRFFVDLRLRRGSLCLRRRDGNYPNGVLHFKPIDSSLSSSCSIAPLPPLLLLPLPLSHSARITNRKQTQIILRFQSPQYFRSTSKTPSLNPLRRCHKYFFGIRQDRRAQPGKSVCTHRTRLHHSPSDNANLVANNKKNIPHTIINAINQGIYVFSVSSRCWWISSE